MTKRPSCQISPTAKFKDSASNTRCYTARIRGDSRLWMNCTW